VWVEVVIANDACENSPWKLVEKMTYVPAPQPTPQAQPPVTNPAPAPTPQANASPAPPSAPAPPAAPSITAPTRQPAVPKTTPKAAPPALGAPTTLEPPKEGRTWLTPLDPYERADNRPPKLNKASLARTDQPSEVANSNAALIGLLGIFLLMVGTGAIGWTRFRRYDDQRLEEIMNPEGKLPTHLDPNATDMAGQQGKKARKFGLPRRRKAALPTADAPTPAPAAAGKAAKPKKATTTAVTAGGRQGPLAHLSDEERASMSEEELAEEKAKVKTERKIERKRGDRARRKAPLPHFDPTAPGADAAAAAEAAAAVARGPMSGKRPQSDDGATETKKSRRWLRRRSRRPQPDPVAPEAPQVAPEAPQVADTQAPQVADTQAPQVADTQAPQGTNGKPPPGAVPPPAAPPANGRPMNRYSYRKEVESELQRILDDAGLHAEVDGILADAKEEAQRQGVPIDSELMLKVLCDETNGAAKLSDSAKGELESRFKRIVAEERGERRPAPDG
jgi:hypothetical protein